MIGDSVTDALAAKNADVPFIGIESGLYTHRELCLYGAMVVFEDMNELAKFLVKIYFS